MSVDDPVLRWDGAALTVDDGSGLLVKPLSASALAAAVLRVAVGDEAETAEPADLAAFRREWLDMAGDRWALPASSARDWWARRHPAAVAPELAAAVAEPHATEGEWLTARRRGLGGSDAATVFGVPGPTARHRSRLGLFLEKTGQIEPQPPGDPEAAAWGHRLEDDVLDWYQERIGRAVVRPGRFTIYRSRAVPFASVTPDGLVLDDPRGLGVVNAKTTSAFLADRWAKDPPLDLQVNLAHEMMVTGAAWGALPVLIGGQRAEAFELDRDEAFILILIAREREFWDLVEAQTPPPDDDDPAAMRAVLKRRFPRSAPGLIVTLPDEAMEWDERRRVAMEYIAQHEREKTDAENKLIAAIGDAEAGVLPSGVVYRRRVIQRAAYLVPAGEYRELRRINQK